jgi:hypothetical protein
MTLARKLAIALTSGVGATLFFAGPVPAAAYGSTMAVSIAGTMTLSNSSVEVEFPVTVACDPIGAYDSYVFVRLTQSDTGATGSGSARPLTCDSTPHTYLIHVFSDNTPFTERPADATAYA